MQRVTSQVKQIIEVRWCFCDPCCFLSRVKESCPIGFLWWPTRLCFS